jgi:hypothetical protein
VLRASNLGGKARLDVVIVRLDLVISKHEWTLMKQGEDDFARELQSVVMDLSRYVAIA